MTRAIEIAKMKEQLQAELPVLFARASVPKLMPGVLSKGHLANLNCGSVNNGPKYLKLQGKVVCERESFLDWMFGPQSSVE